LNVLCDRFIGYIETKIRVHLGPLGSMLMLVLLKVHKSCDYILQHSTCNYRQYGFWDIHNLHS